MSDPGSVSGLPEALHISGSDQSARVTQTPKRPLSRQNTRWRSRLQVRLFVDVLCRCARGCCNGVCYAGRSGSGFSRWILSRGARRCTTTSKALRIASCLSSELRPKICSAPLIFPTTRCVNEHSVVVRLHSLDFFHMTFLCVVRRKISVCMWRRWWSWERACPSCCSSHRARRCALLRDRTICARCGPASLLCRCRSSSWVRGQTDTHHGNKTTHKRIDPKIKIFCLSSSLRGVLPQFYRSLLSRVGSAGSGVPDVPAVFAGGLLRVRAARCQTETSAGWGVFAGISDLSGIQHRSSKTAIKYRTNCTASGIYCIIFNRRETIKHPMWWELHFSQVNTVLVDLK